MSFTLPFRRTLLAALLGAAAATAVVPHAAAQVTSINKQIEKRVTADAMAAAQRDLAKFVAHQSQRQGSVSDFPLQITSLQELKHAKIAYGFAVHTIDPADLLAGRSNLRAMAKPVNQWRFVITINERPVGMATVERVQGRMETVAYGAAVLAKDLDFAAKQHGNADKSNLRFLRIYQARSDFLEVDSADGRGRFAPLHSARESLSLKQGAHAMSASATPLLDETDLVQPLRAVVKQSLAAPL